MHSPVIRPVTAAEVEKWFKRGHKPWPSQELYAEIAERLSKMRWPVDPPLLPVIGDDEWWVRDNPGPDDPDPPWRRESYTVDPSWNDEEATAAAKVLLDSIPAMLWHWQRMQWTRVEAGPDQKPARLREGYFVISRLYLALEVAMDYIEFPPLGKSERQDHRKHRRPKPWHTHALGITPIIADALKQSGHPVLSTTHNTAIVRIVREALVRIGYDKNIKPAAVAAFLTKWYAKFGRFDEEFDIDNF